MKKFYFVFAMALCSMAFAFVSCSDEKEEPTPQPHGIAVVEAVAGGTITVSPLEAKAGDVVTLTATVEDEWEFGGWEVTAKGVDVKVADATATTTTFVMPDAAVIVSASFLAPDEKYDIAVVEVVAGGTITVSPLEAKAGDVVTLTATVDDKWEFGGWDVTAKGTEVEVADVTATTTTFVMPDAAVTVAATFLAPGDKYGLTTVRIPAGTRMLGSKSDEPSYYRDEKLHQVTLTKDFYMSAYEVTNQQFADFLNAVGVGEDGEGPVDDSTESYVYDSTTRDSGKFNFGVNWDGTKWVAAPGYEEHPIIYVSWYGADAYAKWVGGALPTEAQWEYACRGGQAENLPFGIGDGTKMVKGMAQFYITDYYDLAQGGRVVDSTIAGYVASTYKVGSFEPNGYGLYDMHGNVYEWVSDWYDNYPDGDLVDPIGPETGSRKILRGGGWVNSGRELRSAVRWYARPTSRMENQGFRVIF